MRGWFRRPRLKPGATARLGVAGCVVFTVVCFAGLARTGLAQQTPQRPPAAQDEFVPLSELPPDEQLPAPRLLAAAYGFVWVALTWYVWSLSRRLRRVEREVETAIQRARTPQ